MSQQTVCVLGGSGFVGKHLVARLNELDIDCKILTRSREKHRDLLVLPRCQLIEADVFRIESLRAHFKDCSAVINLVGILNESQHDGSGFRKAHVELTRLVLQAMQQTGVKKILHMSALNADASKGRSYYLRTKGEAEDYLHTFHGSIHLTSFRPSVIFGPGDSFFNRFAALLKKTPSIFPLACANARFAPVYVGDVVNRFVETLLSSSKQSQRINLCGPEVYTLKELVEYTAAQLNLKRKIIGIPAIAAIAQAIFMEYFIPTKPFTLDNYNSMLIDSICTGSIPMPTGIQAIVPQYIGQRDQRSYYQRYRQDAHRDELQ